MPSYDGFLVPFYFGSYSKYILHIYIHIHIYTYIYILIIVYPCGIVPDFLSDDRVSVKLGATEKLCVIDAFNF